MSEQWVKWITALQAIAQNGLTYATGQFDRERYQALLDLTAEITATHTQSTQIDVLNLFFEEKIYRTPSMDVRGAVFKDNTLLMVQESNGLWGLPGGWADVNMSPSFNAEREVIEETGLTVKAVKLIALYDKLKHEHPPEWPHAYKCFFLCDIISGELKTSFETQAVAFFPLDKLPPLCPNRITLRQIQRCFEHYYHRDLPTEFD